MSITTEHPILATLRLFGRRIPLIWLLLYCLEINLIERYWKLLKDLACVNRLCISLEDAVAFPEHILSQQNDLTSGLRWPFSKY